jgi:hypothetical protein
MGSNLGFVVKVIGLSALIAIAIKYAAPLLAAPTTPANVFVLLVVLLPSLLLGLALGWRVWRRSLL